MQSLTTELKNRLKAAKRIAVLGVGSELRGDDVAGMLVAGAVQKKSKKIRVFLGATAPENLTGEIIKFKPTHLIIVDTADIKEKPGTILFEIAGVDETLARRACSRVAYKMPVKCRFVQRRHTL